MFRTRSIRLLGVMSLWMILCAASNPSMQDIEGAIIAKDFLKAEQLAGDMIAGNPSKADMGQAQYYLALSELYLAKYDQAKVLFQELKDKGPDAKLREKAALGFVDALSLSGDYENALNNAEAILKSNPRSPVASLLNLKIARANLKLARWSAAREQLETIIRRYPKSLEAYSARQLLEEKQYFCVQVGSFLNRERSEILTADLNKNGQYAYIVETVDKTGQKFYRVRIGQFSRLEDARKMESDLARQGYPTIIYP